MTVPRVDANGKTWKFCTKCKCRATGAVGIYQLSHYDAEHVDNYRRPGSTPAANPAASSDTSEAPPEVPTATAPQGNLTSVANPNLIPPGPPDVTVRFATDEAHDIDEIEFTGMWCAMVDDDIDVPTSAMFQVQLYCTSVDASTPADATITSSAPFSSGLIVERENVDNFEHVSVETVDDDDSVTDASGCNDDEDITVITMFPNPDDGNADDTDGWDIDYPSTDDDTNIDDDLTNNESFGSDDADLDDYWHGGTLSEDVRYDLLHPSDEDEFYDAVEVEPTVTVYQDVEYFDSIAEEVTYPLSWFRPQPDHWLAYRLKVGAFWASTIFWDSIVYLLSPSPPLPRRIRRRRHRITVPAYPKAWMLLTSCLMIGQAALQGPMPALKVQTPHEMIKHARLCGLETYERMVRLEEMLILNAETLLQYHA